MFPPKSKLTQLGPMSPYALDGIIGTFWGVLTVSLRASSAHLRLLEKMIIFRHSRGAPTNLLEKVFIFPKMIHYSRGPQLTSLIQKTLHYTVTHWEPQLTSFDKKTLCCSRGPQMTSFDPIHVTLIKGIPTDLLDVKMSSISLQNVCCNLQ